MNILDFFFLQALHADKKNENVSILKQISRSLQATLFNSKAGIICAQALESRQRQVGKVLIRGHLKVSELRNALTAWPQAPEHQCML